jgi:hypothetical protein
MYRVVIAQGGQCTGWSMYRVVNVQSDQSQLHFYQFIARCIVCFLFKSNIKLLKMCIKKDNMITVHQNGTFSGSCHLSFTQFRLHNPNKITVQTVHEAALP